MNELVKAAYPAIVRLLSELVVIALIFRYWQYVRFPELKLTDAQVDTLVDEFDPGELVPGTHNAAEVLHGEECRYELADFDAFGLANSNKDAVKDTIANYGVGTCGPRGFYGTLDLHLVLEKRLRERLGTEGAILYPNSFTCISSVISCFCKPQDIIFYHRDSSEAILRGISITRAETISFGSIKDLHQKVMQYRKTGKRNFVVTEALFRNTGAITDLPELIKTKKMFKLRIILDETYSFPALGERGISSYFGTSTQDIDVIIGSLAHFLCANGAFSAGNERAVEYQRLNAQAYCFSASLPGFLTQSAILNLSRQLDTDAVFALSRLFREKFSFSGFVVVSSLSSPISVFTLKTIYDGYRNGLVEDGGFEEMCRIRDCLRNSSIRVAAIEHPFPAIRVLLKAKHTEKDVEEIAAHIGNALGIRSPAPQASP